MREAAVMIVINDNGEVLAVSRRYDKTKFGLPGGKKEDNETIAAAGVRETLEETGIKVLDCVYLYRREEAPDKPGGEWFYTSCFLAVSWEGTPTNSNEGEVKWLTVKDLTDKDSAFPDYNLTTFAKLQELYPAILLA